MMATFGMTRLHSFQIEVHFLITHIGIIIGIYFTQRIIKIVFFSLFSVLWTVLHVFKNNIVFCTCIHFC
jgi:hypothetical protein